LMLRSTAEGSEAMTALKPTAAQTRTIQNLSKGGHHDPSQHYATQQQANR
jgi:hypothetical protein